jgi:hypothetical protein
MKAVSTTFLLSTFWLAMFLTIFASHLVDAQQVERTPAKSAGKDRINDEGATIKGTVEFDPNFKNSWNGADLEIPFPEIKTKLFQQVELPPVPLPADWNDMNPEAQQAWAKSFEESEAGKTLLAEQDKLLSTANDFDVILEKDGKFVVYDVPPGIYRLRGRVDKELKGTTFGFEVFAQIEVAKKLNEVRLPPIQVAVTPMLKAGEIAPPIDVESMELGESITLNRFKNNYVLVSFWITNSPSAAYQNKIQEAFIKIQDKHPIQLLSICVDEQPEQAKRFILEEKLGQGSHGFTGGFGHRTMLDYGIRAIPSFWLISPDGKISMSQYDFANAFRVKNDLMQIISDRIEGTDALKPADSAAPSDTNDSAGKKLGPK